MEVKSKIIRINNKAEETIPQVPLLEFKKIEGQNTGEANYKLVIHGSTKPTTVALDPTFCFEHGKEGEREIFTLKKKTSENKGKVKNTIVFHLNKPAESDSNNSKQGNKHISEFFKKHGFHECEKEQGKKK